MPRCDRISELPESLITQILLHLPTKDSVKTSVLSTRWKNLWLNVPGLDLNTTDFSIKTDDFINFINRFLQFNPESRLHKFKVNYSSYEVHRFKDRIGTVVNRGIQHLDLQSNTYYLDDDDLVYPCIEFMPLNLYVSKTLVSLKLSFSGLEDPGFVSLPCLKTMYLRGVRWHSNGGMNLEKLVSGCPVLEELIFLRNPNDELVVTRVRSRSLKRFCVPALWGEMFRWSSVAHTLEIDAPGLECMSLKEDQYDRIVVKNLTCLFMVDLDIKFAGKSFDPEDLSKRNEIRNFLTGISTVRHMIISQKTLKALDLYSKVGMIPKFNHLSRLQALFPSSLLQFLPSFLESFPNLKHLILNFVYSEPEEMEMEGFELVDVSRCFVSTLECVEIKGIFEWEENVMELVGYFLENAALLKKLIVSFIGYPLRDPESNVSDIYEELNRLTKLSPSCSIVLDCE
ncbi:F-box/FBD/LRR-repeat protein [Cardamine amara subsp. amara]|uniref:F-box/FBD/LRR-repeat protein n=1 Tax=Cardamine amara subsp. amara TaxID=228776 RepID=A0ABD1BS86_CARAN